MYCVRRILYTRKEGKEIGERKKPAADFNRLHIASRPPPIAAAVAITSCRRAAMHRRRRAAAVADPSRPAKRPYAHALSTHPRTTTPTTVYARPRLHAVFRFRYSVQVFTFSAQSFSQRRRRICGYCARSMSARGFQGLIDNSRAKLFSSYIYYKHNAIHTALPLPLFIRTRRI